jgi:lysophospholipase L1-like esterase
MIVCIGDSITVGQHLDPPDVPWPVMLNTGPVLVRGVSGETTRQGLERFPRDVQMHEPELVVIQFGHNDCNRWETDRGLPRVSPEAYVANLGEMIDRCRRFGAVPYLCTLTPSRRSEQHAQDVIWYDSLLRGVAAERGVALIDTRAAFDAEPLDDLLVGDGLHLTGEGHRLYARTVSAVLA